MDEPPDGRCERARWCPGWFVSEDVYLRRCETCRALPTDEQARESALAAGLDVQRSGYVAGVSGWAASPRRSQSAMKRSVVSVNEVLSAVLDQLQDAQKLPELPGPLRSCVDQLIVEVAKVQGVSEWVGEGLARLVEEADVEEVDPED